MSGKAIQNAAPPAGTARELTRRIEESEGHVTWLRPLFLHQGEALPAPKMKIRVISITRRRKLKTVKGLEECEGRGVARLAKRMKN